MTRLAEGRGMSGGARCSDVDMVLVWMKREVRKGLDGNLLQVYK